MRYTVQTRQVELWLEDAPRVTGVTSSLHHETVAPTYARFWYNGRNVHIAVIGWRISKAGDPLARQITVKVATRPDKVYPMAEEWLCTLADQLLFGGK